jgi:hypothetical protein
MTPANKQKCLDLAKAMEGVIALPGGTEFVTDLFLGIIEPAGLVVADKDELERLRGALAPFAEFAGGKVGRPPADTPITMGSRIARRQLTMGDCARAADAMNPA